MTGKSDNSVAKRWQRIARWFLAVSYGVGSPAFATAEAMTGVFSARFDYSPGFLYFVSVVQFACAVSLALNRAQLLSLAGLTVMSIGAVYSHFKIGSPLTSIPSLAFTAIQLWYAWQIYGDRAPRA